MTPEQRLIRAFELFEFTRELFREVLRAFFRKSRNRDSRLIFRKNATMLQSRLLEKVVDFLSQNRIEYTLTKRLYLCSILLLWFANTHAQTKIPDANFAAAIRKVCPTCIDANNTLLPPAATLTSLNVRKSGISDLTGIAGFSSLQTIGCDSNQLSTLPALPNSLRLLFCSNNQLTTLPILPNSITDLWCDHNQLTTLPALPNSLREFFCNNNQLTTLPTLPNSLRDLICLYNQLTTLPTLPNNLTFLDCFNNQLTSLPSLPNNLTYLNVGSNKLNSLPTLPNTLQYLYCFGNQLSQLPILSNTLKEIRCGDNQLTSLPVLSEGLVLLWCNDLPLLSCLPTLPNSLKELTIYSNKINCLPNLIPNLVVYNTTSTNKTAIPTPPICTNPTATLTGAQTVSAGQTANLSVALTGTGPWEFQLSDGKTYTATASPYIIAISPTATTTYTLTSVKANCNTGTVGGQAVLTVNQCSNLPTVGISSGGKFLVCAGITLTLSSSVSGGSGGYSYQWKKEGTAIGGNNTNLDVSDAGQYMLTATDSKGCAGNSGMISVTKSSPTATITGQNSFCIGTNTTLTATVQNTTGTLQYQWKQDGKNVGDGKNIWAVSQSGNYSIEITDANGCKATSAATTVTEKGSDLVSIVKPDGPITVYAPNTAALSATLGYEKDARFKYQWRKDGKDIAGATHYVHYAATSGSYAATISDADCAVTSSEVKVTVLVPTAVSLNATDELLIYPNPTDGLVIVSAHLQKMSNLAVRLIDLQGRIVETFELSKYVNFENRLDLSSYPTGTYILEIEGKELMKRIKIVKK